MENAIRNMLTEYKEKIHDEDIRLKSVNDKIAVIRKDKDYKFNKLAIMDMDDLRQERHVINARRQAYVQASSDFDSLIDNL